MDELIQTGNKNSEGETLDKNTQTRKKRRKNK